MAPEIVTAQRAGELQAGGILAIAGLLCILLLIAAAVRRALRGRAGSARLFAFSVSVGNALMDVAAIVQPDRPNVESLERELGVARRRAHRAAVGDGREPGTATPPANEPGPYR